MAFEKLPNNGTLFTNKKKAAETHPDYDGYLLIDRALLVEMLKENAGHIELEVKSWIKETQAGATNINLKCGKPYKKNAPPAEQYAPAVIHEPTAHQPPATKAPPTSADAQKYLDKLKISIAKIENYPQFEELYNKIHSPKVWEVFKANTAIAQEASSILSVKKGELILAIKPVDLSAIIAAINVECDRLKLPKKEHCLIRWNKSRAQLDPLELEIYLAELKAADPNKDDFF